MTLIALLGVLMIVISIACGDFDIVLDHFSRFSQLYQRAPRGMSYEYVVPLRIGY